MTPRTSRQGYDVFISHSSVDARLAFQLEATLQEAGLTAWLDRSDIRVGTLLRDELHSSLKASRRMLLLWSKSAAASRWVAAELLTAFHEKTFIIPCILDAAPLPYFLSNAIFLDFRKARHAAVATLPDVVRRAPSGPSKIPSFRDSPSPELRAATNALSGGQMQVTDALGRRNLAQARQRQASIYGAQRAAERKWPLDATVLSLGGYHRKNAYMVKHWDAIQAGQPPKDPLLVQAERLFFRTLFVNPNDMNGLNGLGSILIYERDFDAAEFFVRRALAHAQREGVPYAAAQHDLQLIRWFKRAPS